MPAYSDNPNRDSRYKWPYEEIKIRRAGPGYEKKKMPEHPTSAKEDKAYLNAEKPWKPMGRKGRDGIR